MELVVQILRRLPYRSLCRFSNHVPSPLHCDFAVRFAPAGSSPFPGLGFLPCVARALPLDCCNGLLLCRAGGGAGGCHYVCNPATGKFTVLPKPSSGFQALALAAFEPHGASPRFHGLEVFSSVTRKWVHACLDYHVRLVEGMGSVFINGFVNLLTHEKKVLAVDPEGRAWRLIPLPVSSRFGLVGCLGQSQGFLHYAVQEGCGCTMMQVWILKDFGERIGF
ncbi:uncharacterized protein [Miscanthus floridulus]|uniref:uncharacterized protein n=1 Tax=Miscanthus floridulus TaxID=154761 RepID=UPI00345ABBFA